jgi:8-oxo-dGTP pyrophosphatase MutT (NUDIX family)
MIAMDHETGFAFPVPNVSAIIERRQGTRTQVLVQVRWKPAKDPVYSGTFEIPAGGINLYENVYDALKREVFEETGLQVTGFRPDIKTRIHSQNGDDVFAFVPFCCQQQVTGHARVGFVFVCTVEGTTTPAPDEVGEITWLDTAELRRLVEKEPERIFTFQLPVLAFYLTELHSTRPGRRCSGNLK